MKALLSTACGRAAGSRTPIWFMRQAGRYLPEYRAIRDKYKDIGFLGMCYDPNIASEITMQPIHRFDLDAAIIFSDILILPHALGWPVEFVPNHGPKLDVFAGDLDLRRMHLSKAKEKFALIGSSIAKVSSMLPKLITMIGFAGSPFTVAAYMLSGGKIGDGSEIRAKLNGGTDISMLLELLTEATIIYLETQIEAGAEVLQLFESHALQAANESWFEKYVILPNKRIASTLKSKYPEVPLIFFPRYSGTRYDTVVSEMLLNGPLNVLGIDETVGDQWVREQQDKGIIIQGNLDNHLLCYGTEAAVKERVDKILHNFKMPFVFNLGHGILKETNPEMVAKVISCVRHQEASA